MIIAICLVIAVLCFVAVYFLNKSANRTEGERTNKIDKLVKVNQIEIAKRYDAKLRYTLLHDTGNKCIWCIVTSYPEDVIKRFNYHHIVQVELKEDDESVISTSRGGQLGGALVGSVLAGGVGAVVGGLSGKKKQKKTVSKIQLIFTLDDLDNPVYTVEFARFRKPVETNDYRYKQAHEEAFGWFKLVEVIIKKSLKESDQKPKEEKADVTEGKAEVIDNVGVHEISSTVGMSSVADELSKLGALLKEGILTEEEFVKQKNKLLS